MMIKRKIESRFFMLILNSLFIYIYIYIYIFFFLKNDGSTLEVAIKTCKVNNEVDEKGKTDKFMEEARMSLMFYLNLIFLGLSDWCKIQGMCPPSATLVIYRQIFKLKQSLLSITAFCEIEVAL